MELSQLRYFIKCAELQHLTKAAAELKISQPALTKVIRQLEEELDVELFERRGRNIFLTESGQVLLQRANELTCFANDIYTEISELKKRQQEITVVVRALGGLIPDITKGFINSYPDVRLKLLQDDDMTMQNLSYDLIISTSFLDASTPNSTLLLREPFKIGLSRQNPLSQKDTLSLFDMQDLPYLSYSSNRLVSSLIDQNFQKVGFTPNRVLQCDNSYTLSALTALDAGYAILPAYTWVGGAMQDIRLFDVQDCDFSRNISVSWKAKSYLSETARLFKNHIVQYFRKQLR